MPKTGPRAIALFDRLVALLARLGIALAAVALLVSLGLIAYSVILRYFFNRPPVWVDETVGYLLVATVMLAAADALRKGEHIAVDIITERLGRRGQRATAAIGLVAVGLLAAIFVQQGWAMVAFSQMVGLVSTGSLSIPMALPQIFVPVGGALLLLAAIAGLLRMTIGLPPTEEESPAETASSPALEKKVGIE